MKKVYKTKSFIYQLINLVKVTINNLHIKAKNYKEPITKNNLYEIFLYWFIDIIQYGFLMLIALTIFTNFTFINKLLLIIPLGILRWLVLDTYKNIKNI